MFEGFFQFFAGLLAWWYALVPNYGFAIIALTITVMVVITPLTLKSTKSMIQMQRLQPELKKLQEKHKGDREALNAEMMAFYKENQINPVSGCVPVLAQAPVFIVLYRVLHGITTRLGGGGSGSGHAVGQQLTGVRFTPWILTDQPFRPQHLSHSTELYQSLSHSTTMNFLGMDLALSPLQALRMGFIVAIPFLILMAAMLVSQIVQNRQIQGRNTNNQASSQQQMLMKVLPFLLPVFSFQFPAGLGLYYFTQGICRIGTQAYITRKFYGEGAHKPVTASTIETTATPKSTSKTSTNGSGATKKPAEKVPPSTRKPGTSAKSQAAHKKTAGQPGTGRKSGAPRGGPQGPGRTR
jgi:YidC/Oxa1 family membrane protein insertase